VHHPKTLPKIEAVSIVEFFEWICPTILHASGQACLELGGRFAFSIVDAGCWTIDLGNVAVEPFFDRTADVRVRISREDFLALIAGTASLPAWASSGRVSVEGDVRSLSRLSVVFSALADEGEVTDAR
jgi:SCP-2 sterol transfer family protein